MKIYEREWKIKWNGVCGWRLGKKRNKKKNKWWKDNECLGNRRKERDEWRRVKRDMNVWEELRRSKKMKDIISKIEEEKEEKIEEKRKIKDFKKGEKVRVKVRVKEGKSKSVKEYEGVWIER